MTVAIVDFGLCNLDSVSRAVEECGNDPIVTRDPRDLGNCDRIILPGVGAFGQAMKNLEGAGLNAALRRAVTEDKTPLLGICLGMHLLAECGTEGGLTPGLSLLSGTVKRLDPRDGDGDERIPHIGWNDVTPQARSPLFEGVNAGTDLYFVHSYCLESPPEETLATVEYCGLTVAAAGRDNVVAVQFHPEKSQTAGFRLLKNFLGA